MSNNSRILSVKTIILWYFSRADTKSTKDLLRKTSLELFEQAKNGSYLDNVKFEIFGDEIANREMVRGAIEVYSIMEGFSNYCKYGLGNHLDVHWCCITYCCRILGNPSAIAEFRLLCHLSYRFCFGI